MAQCFTVEPDYFAALWSRDVAPFLGCCCGRSDGFFVKGGVACACVANGGAVNGAVAGDGGTDVVAGVANLGSWVHL